MIKMVTKHHPLAFLSIRFGSDEFGSLPIDPVITPLPLAEDTLEMGLLL